MGDIDRDRDFTVILPSNSNMLEHRNNKPEAYAVELPHEIKLNGEWEVALMGIQYTHGWLTLRHSTIIMFIARATPDRPYGESNHIAFNMHHYYPSNTKFYFGPLKPHAEPLGRHQQENNGAIYNATLNSLNAAKITYNCGYLAGGYYENVHEVANAVIKLFNEVHPNTPIKLLFDYDYAEKKAKFRSMFGEVTILTSDPQIGDMLGLEAAWLPCGLCTLNPNGTFNWTELRNLLNGQRRNTNATENTRERRRNANRVRREVETPEDSDTILSSDDISQIHRNEIIQLEKLIQTVIAEQEEEEEEANGEVNERQVVDGSNSDNQQPRQKRSTATQNKLPEGVLHWWALANYGRKAPKINRVTDLWVYTDLIERQLVGNVKVPLLGIIPSTAKTGDRCYHTPNPLNYVPVSRSNIKSIRIEIRDDKGEPVKFLHSGANEDNLICHLRFRRRKV